MNRSLPTFDIPEFEAEFQRNHENCPSCHPDLPPRRIDWYRAAVWLGILSGSLALWIVGITYLATRWN